MTDKTILEEVSKEFEIWREKQDIMLCRYSDISVELNKVAELTIRKATEKRTKEIREVTEKYAHKCIELDCRDHHIVFLNKKLSRVPEKIFNWIKEYPMKTILLEKDSGEHRKACVIDVLEFNNFFKKLKQKFVKGGKSE